MEKETQDFSAENCPGEFFGEHNLVGVAGMNSEPSVKIEVLFFAKAREITGLPDISLQVPPSSSAGDCLKILLTKFPRLEEICNSIVFALNEEYAPDSIILKNGDELAIIPPISGG
ncbi:molybdopterin synthase sulfur carrier subunit isoform X1 [Dendrobium catenatum]|uniref:Molybdopterin synthase sulfur carrier subunit n=1 Tax=Dendrobium catenatum TaxID=906689 RepID=A0A2I0VXW9_9ASPA|nr:molybdopterin synthase sulfur carrier subunit isoform X1 [Dendrobium catenatum]XP_020672328.1 molybdopterin synthase sulfur carrier subunit isoform X1 [Dendrobium catenatum]XP_020672329.1 molybdopterin synthase sulfur carrier subunit isoform X1 [Dendrobium catenatum]XP_020672331.1 molybdopterin synthase sulfur carrier subunit isoform X1 [Dendrobium catenatum]XP_020672332.1 molybdopterin synthase sulfur carrier subunit isoform X1 [Dendrobium catenatum]XP_020672333.1 molybdopterin synthase su